MIDAAVKVVAIFANKEQKRPYIAVQKKLLYKGINEENSELINSVVFDDLFKIERIDTALKCYDTYIKKERKRALTRKNECFAAYICSLFMEIPFPLLSKVQGFFEEFLMRAIDGGNKESYDNYIKEIHDPKQYESICKGYIIHNNSKYYPYLRCIGSYATEGYNLYYEN